MLKIVLDPGHGGNDPGAANGYLYEKKITLTIATETARFLNERYAAAVFLTRTSDVTVGLSERANFANNLKADYFVSLHVNAGGGTGFESYIHPRAGLTTQKYRDTMHNLVAGFYTANGFPDRGKKKANFAVLRETTMPSILLENLFIDHPTDLAALKNPAFLKKLGEAIGGGIAQTLQLETKTPGDEAPGDSAGWDPAAEIERLRKDGLLVNDHDPRAPVTWGEFATVLNRLRDRLA